MRKKPEIGSVSIALIGNFNPAIFSPQWFARYGLLTDREAEAADLKLVHPEVTQFSCGWLTFTAERQRCIVESSEAPWIRLHDLLLKMFTEQVPHTPMHTMGINRVVHFSAKNQQARYRFGEILAPRGPWGDWGKLLHADEKDNEPPSGLMGIEMRQGGLNDRPAGNINVRIEPSKDITPAGIMVRVNDHYELAGYKEAEGAKPLMRFLENNFEQSISRSESIIDGIMGSVE